MFTTACLMRGRRLFTAVASMAVSRVTDLQSVRRPMGRPTVASLEAGSPRDPALPASGPTVRGNTGVRWEEEMEDDRERRAPGTLERPCEWIGSATGDALARGANLAMSVAGRPWCPPLAVPGTRVRAAADQSAGIVSMKSVATARAWEHRDSLGWIPGKVTAGPAPSQSAWRANCPAAV